MAQTDELIVSVSGIRGIVGRGLTPAAALSFAQALANTVGGKPVVVCRDGRPSGAMLRHAVVAGLQAGGCTVHDLGIQPTPTCGLAVRQLQAAGGIQITASHNPAPWNGLKLFGADGAVLTAAQGQLIQERYLAGGFRCAAWNELGLEASVPQAADWHRERVLELVNVEGIRKLKPVVLVDANGGAGGPLALRLLADLGCQTVGIACDSDGVFRHEAEPTAENLTTICPQVPSAKAAIGFVLDPDADRLALIDQNGSYIGEELTLALALAYRLMHEPGAVVVNMSTSRVSEDIATRSKSAFHRSAVGEANVVEKMRAVGAVLGGEGNGGVIDPRVGWVRDPFIAMGLILSYMAETGKSLSALVSDLPAYTIIKDKYQVDRAGLPQLFQALQTRWPEAKADKVDGLRLDWSDRWVHVRPSNTEPIVRVIAEAPKAEAARELCRAVGEALTGGRSD
ncbi:phosphoglucosamine mutase [soil metagenome]